MSQTSIMFAYFVTVDRFHRLEKSVTEQRAWRLGSEANSILIVDFVPDRMPDAIRNFFGSRVFPVDSFSIDEHSNRAVCLPKMRNAAIDLARKSDVTWLFFCDADTVIPQMALPKSDVKYAFPYVYWQKSAHETVKESVNIIETGGRTVFSEGNSWFLLHRDAFEQLDFNEHIIGYGWEDYEFNVRAAAKGFESGRCEAHVIHLFHPQEERAVLWWQFNRNKAIFEAVDLELHNQIEPNWRRSEAIGTNHPAWTTHLYFDYDRQIVVNPLAKTLDPFSIEEDRITIRWCHWPAEIFKRSGVFLEYLSPL